MTTGTWVGTSQANLLKVHLSVHTGLKADSHLCSLCLLQQYGTLGSLPPRGRVDLLEGLLCAEWETSTMLHQSCRSSVHSCQPDTTMPHCHMSWHVFYLLHLGVQQSNLCRQQVEDLETRRSRLGSRAPRRATLIVWEFLCPPIIWSPQVGFWVCSSQAAQPHPHPHPPPPFTIVFPLKMGH